MVQDKNKEGRITSFTDLKAWQEGHSLVVELYKQTKKFPKEEVYGLTSQIRRSASSVSANIAEGFGRQSYKEKVHFFYTAQGSLVELKNHLLVARDVGYLNKNSFSELSKMANKTHALLQGLLSKTKSFAEDHES